MPNERSVTIEDVARAAGVSRQTVSNVLNTPAIVRSGTQERVREAIVRLGYSPDVSARRLRTGRSSTIGIHLDPYNGGISGVVLDRFVHALAERAGERGLRVLVYAAASPEEEIRRMADLADGGEVDGIVITGTTYGDARLAWLAERRLPFVSFGRPWGEDDIDDPLHLWVDVDGAAGTQAATAHAQRTAGPRVAFLGWPPGSGTGDDRERGWREAMRAAGATDAEIARLRVAVPESVAEARAATEALLRRDEIDAIVCVSDSLAVGAHVAAVAAQWPELLVSGFDNTPAVEALGITSIEQLPEQVAAGTLDLLTVGGAHIRRRALEAGQAHVLVQPRLIVR